MKLSFPDRAKLSTIQRLAVWERIEREIAHSINEGSPGPSILRGRAVFVLSVFVAVAALLAVGTGIIWALEAEDDPPHVAMEQQWRAALEAGVAADPDTRFPNLSQLDVETRLAEAADEGQFEVSSLDFLHPSQVALRIVVRTSNEEHLSRFVPELVRLVGRESPHDPKSPWAFEGLYLLALGADSKPLLVYFNHWRGDDPGGGQWARSPELLPFSHGGIGVPRSEERDQ